MTMLVIVDSHSFHRNTLGTSQGWGEWGRCRGHRKNWLTKGVDWSLHARLAHHRITDPSGEPCQLLSLSICSYTQSVPRIILTITSTSKRMSECMNFLNDNNKNMQYFAVVILWSQKYPIRARLADKLLLKCCHLWRKKMFLSLRV